METSNGSATESPLLNALHRVGALPGQVESGIKNNPLTTAAAIAVVSFLGGVVLGSRFARAVVVAATPVLAHRLLDGPLGDDINRYLRSVLRAPQPASKTTS